MDNVLPEKVALVKSILQETQQAKFPYVVQALGLELEIHEHVFPFDRYNSAKWMTENLPSMDGEDVLEVGCGMGIAAIYVAKQGARRVTAVDVTPHAVSNTAANVRRHQLDNVKVLRSDIFSAIGPSERFDTIYWHLPSTRVPEDYEFENVLEYSTFDPGRRLLHTFLSEGPSYLRAGGRLILGFNVSRDPQVVEEVIGSHGLSMRILAQYQASLDGMMNFRLYELKPNLR